MSIPATSAITRKQKWHSTPPPPPTPKILNLPRRNRHRRQLKKPTRNLKPPHHHPQGHLLEFREDPYCYCSNDRKGKLESLFGEEREFSRSECCSSSSNVPIVLLNSSASSPGRRRRERVEDEVVNEAGCGGGGGGNGSGGAVLEEKWKFQAEILRAECNFLRKEKDLAFKKLERNKKGMEKCLQSAVQILVTGKTKMIEGNSLNFLVETEIENMIKKLENLQKGSSRNKDMEVLKCSNFEKEAIDLQRRLEKLGLLPEDECLNKLMGDSIFCNGRSTHEEMLRMKMEGLPDRIYDDYANSSVASSTSTSKRIESLPESTFSARQLCQEPLAYDDSKCSGRCKSIVRKIVEQVRAETEQWTQMQVMLGKVREEMQQLQLSCDFWEKRALDSDNQIRILQSSVEEWKEKAMGLETKANILQTELSEAREEIQKLKRVEFCIEPRRGGVDPQSSCLFPLLNKELQENTNRTDNKIDVKSFNEVKNEVKSETISLGKQLEKEKRMLFRRLKGNGSGRNGEDMADRRTKTTAYTSKEGVTSRSPFRDIVNFSPLMR